MCRCVRVLWYFKRFSYPINKMSNWLLFVVMFMCCVIYFQYKKSISMEFRVMFSPISCSISNGARVYVGKSICQTSLYNKKFNLNQSTGKLGFFDFLSFENECLEVWLKKGTQHGCFFRQHFIKVWLLWQFNRIFHWIWILLGNVSCILLWYIWLNYEIKPDDILIK